MGPAENGVTVKPLLAAVRQIFLKDGIAESIQK
jgi:hypothetical protein